MSELVGEDRVREWIKEENLKDVEKMNEADKKALRNKMLKTGKQAAGIVIGGGFIKKILNILLSIAH